MSEIRKIAQNTIWQFAGKIFSTALGLVAIAIMTRFLGVEKFGWYATAIGFLQFIGIFTDFGFTVVTSTMLSQPAFDKHKLLGNLFTWRLITAIATQGIIPLSIFFFPYPAPIKWAAIIMSLSFIGVSLNQILIAYYQTKLSMHIQAIGEVIGRMVLVAGLALVAWGSYGFLPMMAVITLSAFAYTGYLWYKARPIRLQIDKTISKAIFTKIWPTALAVIFNCFYLQGDRLILPIYASQIEVGLYGAAYRVIDITLQISAMLIGLMLPLISFAYSRNNRENFIKESQRAFDLMILFIFPIIAGVFVLAEPIMKFVGGNEFSASGIFLRMQIFTMFGIAFGMIFGHINLAINKQRQSLWIYLAVAVLSMIAYFILIPNIGGRGAAIVRVGSELMAGFGLMLITGYYSKFWPKLKAFFKISSASVIMGTAVHLLQPMNLILSIAFGIIIYGAFILLFKTISPKTLKEALPFIK